MRQGEAKVHRGRPSITLVLAHIGADEGDCREIIVINGHGLLARPKGDKARAGAEEIDADLPIQLDQIIPNDRQRCGDALLTGGEVQSQRREREVGACDSRTRRIHPQRHAERTRRRLIQVHGDDDRRGGAEIALCHGSLRHVQVGGERVIIQNGDGGAARPTQTIPSADGYVYRKGFVSLRKVIANDGNAKR